MQEFHVECYSADILRQPFLITIPVAVIPGERIAVKTLGFVLPGPNRIDIGRVNDGRRTTGLELRDTRIDDW